MGGWIDDSMVCVVSMGRRSVAHHREMVRGVNGWGGSRLSETETTVARACSCSAVYVATAYVVHGSMGGDEWVGMNG